MEDSDEEWVMVKPVLDKDLWNPSSSSSSSSSSNETEKKALKVIFNGEAKHWTDAIPIGNGRLGAMVWGGVTTETINLNGKFFFFKTTHLRNSRIFRFYHLKLNIFFNLEMSLMI